MVEKQLPPKELSELVQRFKLMLLAGAQGERQNEEEYRRTRKEFLGQKVLEPHIPEFIKSSTTVMKYWAFIKQKSDRWAPRREFIGDQFEPLEQLVEAFADGGGLDVQAEVDCSQSDPISQVFITEQLEKAEEKLRSGDFSGSITNSRALVEQVLLAMQKRLHGCSEVNDGDIGKMYKAVQKALHLDPGEKELDTQLRQILSGLTSIVTGLGAVRNAAGDAHARTYNPARHHARLALNAAKTLTGFLFETYAYQVEKGLISEGEEAGNRRTPNP